MDKKTVFILCGSVIGILVALIFGLWVFTLFNNKSYDFSDVEELIVEATDKYYRENPAYLPTDDGKYNLSFSSLTEGGYIEPLGELIEGGEVCSAAIVVVKKGDVYTYIPKLNCGELYITKTLSEQILETNQVVSEGSGLYKRDDNTYYYRGKINNNYVAFGGHVKKGEEIANMWRIISIEDGKVKLLGLSGFEKRTSWDNRYNTTINKQSGYNDFNSSILSDYLKSMETNYEYLDEKLMAKIEPINLCIGKRELQDDKDKGFIECDTLSEKTYLFGTLTPFEYISASIDEDCKSMSTYACRNFNYLSFQQNQQWLMTTSAKNDYEAYTFEGRSFDVSTVMYQNYIFPTIVLNEFAFFNGGSGTLEDPYTIK